MGPLFYRSLYRDLGDPDGLRQGQVAPVRSLSEKSFILALVGGVAIGLGLIFAHDIGYWLHLEPGTKAA